MPNIRLKISYDGTNYSGWQIQNNARTIQGEIEKALKKILKEKVRVIASGRTDAGVHAKGQVANFKTKNNIPLKQLKAALKANLPNDISILSIKETHSRFQAQYDAKSKVYMYTILNSAIDDPFTARYYHKVLYRLDIPCMSKVATELIGVHDFKAFQAKSAFSKIQDTVRTIKKIKVYKKGRFIYIIIEANGFLHNMVRNIVGTLLDIGRGALPKNSIKHILRSKDRKKAGPTAPAKGLTLIKVKY
jgi:tRNA pseudouridine38-40 synthase